MADRYDPKLSLRPGDRKTAGSRRDAPGDDDPLAELAKIVSGRTGGSRARAPVANDPAAAPSGGDVLGDLETELLNDLQASFAAVRDMVATPAAQTAPPPPPTTPARSAPRQGEPPPATSREPPPPAIPPTDFDHADVELLPADLAERLAPQPQPTISPAAPVRTANGGPPDTRAEARPPRAPLPPQPEPRFLSDQAPARVEQPDRPVRAERGADAPEFGGFRPRTTEAPPAAQEPAPPAARGPRSRWEKPEHPASRFAPPKGAAAPPKAPVFDDDDLDPYADLASADDDGAVEFPLDGFGDLPAEHDGDAHAFQDDDLASMVEPRRSRTPLLVASVIGLVLVGGIAVAMFRPVGTGSEEPPIIVADGAPTKITPDEPALAEAEAANKLIYDRVNPAEGTAETTLLTPGEEPIAQVPTDDAASNPITRVIIPGGPGIDAPTDDQGLSLDGQPSTMAAESGDPTQLAANDGSDPSQPIGPRKVRTVIVKPDGTIVESTASEVDDLSAAAAATAAPAAAPAPEPVIAAPSPAPEPAQPQPITDDTAAIAGTTNGELAITPLPETDASRVATAEEPPVLAPPAPAAEPPPAPAANVAAANTDAVDLQPSPPVPSGGMLVQVSSQRTEDAARATFRDLQARYPSILGPYDVNIQRADIPDRGTFFRVRVGPFSASDAQRLCNDLKSAGGDCILAQR